MNKQYHITKSCDRCGTTQGSDLIRTYTRFTKTKGEETIHICQDCIITLIDAAISLDRINWDKLKQFANMRITSTEVWLKKGERIQ